MSLLKLSPKGYFGLVLIIVSLILGKLTAFTFLYFFSSITWRWISISIYLLSWPTLILGLYLAGKEYAKSLEKYASYTHYHRKILVGTSKVINKGKEFGGKVRNRLGKKKEELS